MKSLFILISFSFVLVCRQEIDGGDGQGGNNEMFVEIGLCQ